MLVVAADSRAVGGGGIFARLVAGGARLARPISVVGGGGADDGLIPSVGGGGRRDRLHAAPIWWRRRSGSTVGRRKPLSNKEKWPAQPSSGRGGADFVVVEEATLKRTSVEEEDGRDRLQ